MGTPLPEPFSVRGDPRAVALWAAVLSAPAAVVSVLLAGTGLWPVPWLFPLSVVVYAGLGRVEWDGRVLRWRLGPLRAGVVVDGARVTWSRARGPGVVCVDNRRDRGGMLWIQASLWSGRPGALWAPVVVHAAGGLPEGRAGWFLDRCEDGAVVPPLTGLTGRRNRSGTPPEHA